MTQTEIYDDIYDDVYGNPASDVELPPREILLPPDIVRVCIDYLNAMLVATLPHPTTLFHSRIPSPRPPQFGRLQRSGGPGQTLVTDGAQITVDCYAPTEPGAGAFANLVRAHLAAMRNTIQDGVRVYGVHEFGGPSYQPDPDLEAVPRYSFTVQVVCRMTALAL